MLRAQLERVGTKMSSEQAIAQELFKQIELRFFNGFSRFEALRSSLVISVKMSDSVTR